LTHMWNVVWLSVWVCCVKSATHQSSLFLVIYGKMNHRAILIIPNKIAGV
jgi:hypothetical protein